MSEAHLRVVGDAETAPAEQSEEARWLPQCAGCDEYAETPLDGDGAPLPPPYYCAACRGAAPARVLKRLKEWRGDDPDEGKQRSYDLASMAVGRSRI